MRGRLSGADKPAGAAAGGRPTYRTADLQVCGRMLFLLLVSESATEKT